MEPPTSIPGAGNFDNDGAMDYLAEIMEQLIDTVEECYPDSGVVSLDEGGEDVLMPTIAIMTLLCASCGATPPESGIVQQWREQYLRSYDAQIDGLDPAPGFKQERRRVIEETFEQLQNQARKFWDA